MVFVSELCLRNADTWFNFTINFTILLCKVSLNPKEITRGREVQGNKCLQEQGLSLFF